MTNPKIIRMLLMIAFLFIPFTSLRFSFAGVGEVLILIATILYLFLSHGRFFINRLMKPLIFFWCAFLVVSLLGLCVNVVFFDGSSGRAGSSLFDFASYFFVLVTIVMLADTNLFPTVEAQRFFHSLFLLWGVVFAILYFISLFTPSFLGLKLRYYHFFSPLVDNVHQAASITCAMGFLMFAIRGWSTRKYERIFLIFIGLLFARMAIESGSTKAMMGVVVGSFASLILFISYRPGGRNRFYFNLISFSFFSSIVLIGVSTQIDGILSFASDFFTENDGGNARESLYTNGFNHGLRSFLFGYGPGSHAPFSAGFSDAHNSILTVFLQAGIIGLALLCVLLAKIFYRVRGDIFLVGTLVAILMYVIGGDVMRRLPIWVILVGIMYLSEKRSSSSHFRREIN